MVDGVSTIDVDLVVNRGESGSGSQEPSESPVKSKRGRLARNHCAVCLEEIVDGRHEAIFCEGVVPPGVC